MTAEDERSLNNDGEEGEDGKEEEKEVERGCEEDDVGG